MGKGDIRTKRGKIHRGTFGNARRRKKKKQRSRTVSPQGSARNSSGAAPGSKPS